MKKILVLVLGLGAMSAFASFLPFAEYLASHGIITEKSNEADYRLGDLVLRQEVAAMAVKLRPIALDDNYECEGVFSDVTATSPNTWACRVVEAAAGGEIISTSQGTFRPEADITRAEAVAMLMEGVCLPFRDADTSGISFSSDTVDWQKGLIAAANQYGVSSHSTTFRPNDTASRGEIFAFAKNLHLLSEEYDWCNMEEEEEDDEDEEVMSGEIKLK